MTGQQLRVLTQNPQIVPLADAASDLEAIEALRPRLVRLSRLSEKASDTDVALGSDVMAVALQGYALLKLIGRAEGLGSLREELGVRFSKASRRAVQAAPAALPEAKAA